jgi:RHS repeat-associated protein
VSTSYFVYDNWNLIAEVQPDADGYLWLKKSYLWGQDLAGRLADGDGNAGGIGGLAMVTDYSGAISRHFACYDGNGNISALVNAADGTVSARYEYGPFGELIRATGPMAKANPFRFSTKFCDDESGLVYYGYRYYSPSMGRWISRDPIEEDGGNNLYAFVGNNPINYFDTDGRKKVSITTLIDIIGNILLASQGKDLEEGQSKVAQEMKDALDQGGKKIYGPTVPGGGTGAGKGKKKMFTFKGDWRIAKNVRSGIKLKALTAIGYIGYVTSGQAETDSTSFANNASDYYRNVLRGDTPMADLDAAMIAIDALNLFGNEGAALEIWSALP